MLLAVVKFVTMQKGQGAIDLHVAEGLHVQYLDMYIKTKYGLQLKCRSQLAL